jgi:acetoin utilization deacetylase AcuC-like enzyme
MYRTAIVADRRYMNHQPGRVHPERPERIAAMIEMTEQLTRPSLKLHSPREATSAELALCHDESYIERVERTAGAARSDFDPDTHASADTWSTARLATGGVLTAVESVADGDADNGFAIVRPPGHHARPDRAMGFCFFNNVAVAARWLIATRGLSRVLILDWDVHHGNGTQEMFYTSPEVLYLSLHQYPFYPGTGYFDEIGTAAGTGFTVNAPMPASFGDREYLHIFDELLMPIMRRFKPEFALISAGFDCHHRDPLGGMRVTEDGFTAMARRMKRIAAESCGGKLVAVLEGGYDLQALATGGRAVIDELGRDADEPIVVAPRCPRVMPIIGRARHFLSPYWLLS